ncbi:hypothetical protein AB4343_08805 [Vibrio breoganii]|uniref:Uncharacterized protein n=1 Tax=Vibrio breoganii TaxID=553239 RepID=A0AAP8MYV0_9VIBR|nr:hypothetical protein [Vibrio breoganii]OED97719.1 hypothetical protein A1QE_03415 [Vibrio breoganii ZF-55]PMG85835.1 hypothetical protein BCU81_12685 [Vibrio breoganii]PMG90298.1 hypothetical protein BCU80_15055 [Vibrio breoganii]PMG91880.1 hypothetical protein BCU79_16765 [Vibrio breoganii]PMK55815.1 hypothetical protein BCT98_01590 [Vibrio breoganii]
MNRDTRKQVLTTMAFYNKKGIPFRAKQMKRLMMILEDIFEHEAYLGEQLSRIGRKQIIGYWKRTQHESKQTRKEKYAILALFFNTAQLAGKVPKPH